MNWDDPYQEPSKKTGPFKPRTDEFFEMWYRAYGMRHVNDPKREHVVKPRKVLKSFARPSKATWFKDADDVLAECGFPV